MVTGRNRRRHRLNVRRRDDFRKVIQRAIDLEPEVEGVGLGSDQSLVDELALDALVGFFTQRYCQRALMPKLKGNNRITIRGVDVNLIGLLSSEDSRG